MRKRRRIWLLEKVKQDQYDMVGIVFFFSSKPKSGKKPRAATTAQNQWAMPRRLQMRTILPTIDTAYGARRPRPRCPIYRTQNVTLTLKEIEAKGQTIIHPIKTHKNGARKWGIKAY